MSSARDPKAYDPKAEWLEADGLGGFASGTVAGTRTRRYHALLLAATTAPTGRMVLVNGFDAWVETASERFAISSQAYTPGVIHPDGARRIYHMAIDPWPRWRFRLGDGTVVEQEIFVPHGTAMAVVCWHLAEHAEGSERAILSIRPFLSGRDYHSLHHENPAFRFEAERHSERLVWRPYPGVPAVIALTNGEYLHQPDWYRSFTYDAERARGLDSTEDLASPGVFRWDLTAADAVWIVAAEGCGRDALKADESAADCAARLRAVETRRRKFPSRLHRAADAYIVERERGKTIVAGYPWFTDWGRDTFIAMRGLCLATGRLDDARAILLDWAAAVSEGMLPNRFPDHGAAPEFNAVDASLWFIIAVHDFLQVAKANKKRVTARDQKTLQAAMTSILDGYAKGTRYGIRLDADGLIAAGEPGVQLTWMDAKVGDWVVTPRSGKPVEIQALWLNALRIAGAGSERWASVFARGYESFRARFWNEAGGYLYDVVDCDHRAGTVDPAFRPNQIFAVGGLPYPVLDGDRARRVVAAVEERLLTPIGLRSLAPGETGYIGRYQGGVRERDGAYHQGTVWPWLLGPFVEAWVRVRGDTTAAKREARTKFLEPLLRQLDGAALGHIAEVADGDPPHTPGGCPFQAWSVGEALRLDQVVLKTD
ncbi:MAG: glycogen debranching enzyme family protein [Deltaproteobacteria bacterium]|nr:glycogen debranching enzyme family protein [Deltaproteobacteria bacterium]MBI3388182.1 glycogen debranching enzyme family protein [Deltaproteobacteria bacterium]